MPNLSLPPLLYFRRHKYVNTLMLSVILLYFSTPSYSQRVFINTPDDVYEMTGKPGDCTVKKLGHFCLSGGLAVYSTAFYKDTLYIANWLGDLYRIDLNNPGSCTYLSNMNPPGLLSSYNNLTCDKNGNLWSIDGYSNLYRYNPHTLHGDIIGKVSIIPAGDMLFYKDTLLLSAGDGIYAVDMTNPMNSKRIIPVNGYAFYGLMAYPADCHTTRYFGISANSPGSSALIEFDPVNKKLTGLVCEVPVANIYDAASTFEDGLTESLSIDSLAILSPCRDEVTGSLQVFASSNSSTTTFTLDGTQTNTNGIFSAIPVGPHTLHIQGSGICAIDSTFTLHQGLSRALYQITPPQDCAHPNGFIATTATSEALPILYSFNGGTPSTTPVFDHLSEGRYSISITDAGHCKKDTSIQLSYQDILPLPVDIITTPAYCTANNGSITLGVHDNIPPSDISAALDQGNAQSGLSFTGLSEGAYTLHVYYTQGCRYDNSVAITRQTDPRPAIQAIIKDQRCFSDNGSIDLSITGQDGPYLTSFNDAAFLPETHFESLSPATYKVAIRDSHTCGWDTAFTVQPYPKDPVAMSIDSVNPICTKLNSGTLTISVQGAQAPYWIGFNNATYLSGATIYGLNDGAYILPVIDKNGCIADTARAYLDLNILPQCNDIHVPSAFTPNGDGLNDIFRPVFSPFITQLRMSVYNRYGEVVYSGSPQQRGWDGTYHGAALPAGVYVWMIEYTDLRKMARSQRGTVMLIR